MPNAVKAFKVKQSEAQVHRAILDYLAKALPEAIVHHSPNETDLRGPQAIRMIQKAKSLGTVTGWPDIEILWFGNFWCFEVKAPGNYNVTDAQKETGASIKRAGGQWAVVRSIAEVEDCVAAWKAAAHGVVVPMKGQVS